MSRSQERGSVVGFVITAVILAIIAIGGVYAINRYQSSHTDEPSETAVSSPSTNSTSNSSTTSTPTPAASSSNPTSTPQATSSSQGAGLPQTGPVSTLLSMLAVGTLIAAAASYKRSQRYLTSL